LSWRRVDRLNAKLEALARRSGVEWVDVSRAMQDERGRPIRSLYRFDGIHPSEAGYEIWTRVLRARFDADFGDGHRPAGTEPPKAMPK
jgi:lysophospholipase L1-like esterase